MNALDRGLYALRRAELQGYNVREALEAALALRDLAEMASETKGEDDDNNA